MTVDYFLPVVNISSMRRSPAFFRAAVIIFHFAFVAGNNYSVAVEVMAVDVI